MPKNQAVKRVLVVGCGPVAVGRSAELDYAGTKACQAFQEEGTEVILLNSNPATVMAGKAIADKVYIEPVTFEVVRRIVEMEHPDSLYMTVGGQSALDLAADFSEGGYAESLGLTLLGVKPSMLRKVRDREIFRDMLEEWGEPFVPARVVDYAEDAVEFAAAAGYPVVVRRAYTPEPDEGETCYGPEELLECAKKRLSESAINQVLVEKEITGYKQINCEVLRDSAGNSILVSTLERLDAVGTGSGDSLAAVPAQTIDGAEWKNLRATALNVVDKLQVVGSCTVAFAMHPKTGEHVVLSVSPRVTSTSVLISKATGYPVARVAAKCALGYRLDEIPNEVTGITSAMSEPAVDYCALMLPSFSSTSMDFKDITAHTRATGEVMALGAGFEIALLKAIRAARPGVETPSLPRFAAMTDTELEGELIHGGADRIFAAYEALERSMSAQKVSDLTRFDPWFIRKLQKISEILFRLRQGDVSDVTLLKAKQMGVTDAVIAGLTQRPLPHTYRPAYKMVDTCAAEFEAKRPYFYSTFDEEDEAELYLKGQKGQKPKILIVGSGPAGEGENAAFDYCAVHCARAVREMGGEVVVANNNPNSVSTDFASSDRLYFDPLTTEDLAHVYRLEQPDGVVVQFGGQRAAELIAPLEEMGANILGTPVEAYRMMGDSHLIFNLANELDIPFMLPYGGHTSGSRGVEVDAVCDGEECLIAGMMEFVERGAVCDGEDVSIYPARTLSREILNEAADYTARMAKALCVVGLINVRFSMMGDMLSVTDVNPFASRTLPTVSKITGLPLVRLATQCMLGSKLKDLGYATGVRPAAGVVAVRVPVYPFHKGKQPAMRASGGVLGMAESFEVALYKGIVAAGYRVKRSGGVLLQASDADRSALLPLAERFARLGFHLYASSSVASMLIRHMVACSAVGEGEGDTAKALLESGKVDYVVSTTPGQAARELAGLATAHGIYCFNSFDTAEAMLTALEEGVNMSYAPLMDSVAMEG